MTTTTLQEIEVAAPRRKWPCYPAYKPSEMAWVRRLPEHWRVFRLKNVASVRFSTVDKKTEEGETPVRLCNYTDVYNNDRIVDDPEFMQATATADEIARFTLKKGDVLITKDSEEWNDIAVPAYVTADMPGVLCGYHLAHIRPYATSLDGAYLSRAFTADGVRQQFHVGANGITRYGLPIGRSLALSFQCRPSTSSGRLRRFWIGRRRRSTNSLPRSSGSSSSSRKSARPSSAVLSPRASTRMPR
jgi:hypothetical protein